MKNKITVGIIVGMLLSISLLVTPITAMKTNKIIEEEKKELNTYNINEIQTKYNTFISPFNNQDVDEEEWLSSLKYLYWQVSRTDLIDIYQNNLLTNALDYLFSNNPDKDDETFEMMNQALTQKNTEEEQVSYEDKCKNAFETASKWNFEDEEDFFSKLNNQDREILEEMYNAVDQEIIQPKKQPYYGLLEKIVDKFQENGIDFKNVARLVLIFLWCIVNAGIYILLGEVAALAICAVEGFAVGVGIATLSGDFLSPVCGLLSELLPQLGLSNNSWFSLLSFILGLIVTGVTFLLLYGTPIGQIVGCSVFLMAGIIGIEYIINRYWPTDKDCEKTKTNQINLIKILMARNSFFKQRIVKFLI